MGDGVNQSMVGDIDQELEVVQKVSPEIGMLDICIEEDPLKGAPEPKVEFVGLGTKCRDAGVVDCLQRVPQFLCPPESAGHCAVSHKERW